MNELPTPKVDAHGCFTNTRWPLVFLAGQDPDSPAGQAALAWLCERYRQPLIGFARRWGRNHHDAEDSTQAFFLQLIAKVKLAKADPARGRFRTFLLACFVNHLKQEDEIRGRHPDPLPLEEISESETPRDRSPAEDGFILEWIETVARAALQSLQAEYARLGKADLLQEILPYLDGKEASYAELGARIGQTAGNARATVCRMRSRYRECYEAEVAQTVINQTELTAEMRFIQHFLANQPGNKSW